MTAAAEGLAARARMEKRILVDLLCSVHYVASEGSSNGNRWCIAVCDANSYEPGETLYT